MSREYHARPSWELERELRRRRRADRAWWFFGGWCAGVCTLAGLHLAILVYHGVLP